jgi:hypothetical protein
MGYCMVGLAMHALPGGWPKVFGGSGYKEENVL